MVEGKIDGVNMEKRFIKPDGNPVWVHMTINKYKDEINRDAHIVMVMDITARRKDGRCFFFINGYRLCYKGFFGR